MIPLVFAAYCLCAPAAFFVLLVATGFVGSKLSGGEFSWVRYGIWLSVALAGGVLLLAARTSWVFLVVAVLLVMWVLLRAAADAQSTTLREKVGFIQLYAGLSLVEYGALRRASALSGTGASASFTFALHDYLGHLALSLPSAMLGHGEVPPWAEPAAVVGRVAELLASHWLLAAALSTFGVAAFVYAYFAEHATPEVGLALLPAPTIVAVLFALVWGVAFVFPTTMVVGLSASLAAIFLTPFFVAEGVWVVHRLAGRLRTRTAWASLLAASSVILPGLAALLATLGWTFHLVRIRAFEPILGDVKRSAARPRLRTAFAATVATSALLAGLGLADGAVLRRASPSLSESAEACGHVTFTPGPNGVAVSGPAGQYTIDTDETPLAAGATLDVARATCERKGERLCTSDEWNLVCVCTYPNEAVGGSKVSTNERMVYRQDSDRAGAPEDVRQLLTGSSELVTPSIPGGGVLVAGPNDALDDPWAADCRYRGLLTKRSFEGSAGSLVAARCCK